MPITEFRPSYTRGAVMQASLAAIGFLSGVTVWLLGAGILWAVGGVILGTPIPLTPDFIAPTNKQLLDPGFLDMNSDLAKKLLVRWGRLHVLRRVGCVASPS